MKIRYLFILGLSGVMMAQTPTLSELEQTKLELYKTQLQVLNYEGNAVQRQIQELIKTLNTEYKDYQFNPQTGVFVATPKPMVKPAAPQTPKIK